MRIYLPLLLFILAFIVLDIYAFKALRLVSSQWTKPLWKYGAQALYWLSSLVIYALIIIALVRYNQGQERSDYYIFFMSFGLLLLVFMPKLVVAFFHLFEDILHLFRRVAAHFVQNTTAGTARDAGISRWQFLTRLGWILAAIPFVSILYGMARGRYNFRVERASLNFSHLPEWARGLKIVHISDIHIGSFFNNKAAVERGVNIINELQADLILFTGDMVNNFAEELDGWEDLLSQMQARLGKFSVLGNHDYGDYVPWSDASAKSDNLEELKKKHAAMGFKLLNNELFQLRPESAEQPIEILGVENWGLGGFSQYGKLDEATKDSNPEHLQILLSHDPSHWDAEVREKTRIDLTLAGHTHGMQFGVEIPGIVKWSPVKYRYPRWGGLYNEQDQYLYVNRGFGYIGFPGRVGMPPEITLIELS